ncbi:MULTISPECIES: hypothetical protein [unclassified Corynebacterium]|uniref:hypothetical protein n=1 Tax=unclassified Corynebacterium TaxID=2624378 RepID=UPI0029CA41AA|nr:MULTISPECIES: hypothetical protein [unclassified Corynebacterium]WPF65186.1 hypothetical protein OLX12_06205 [Corynebacterium sp. 22KM0430]WPF67682.1 hypothetical protein OLW90_06200 [Corynebacterium sp. 21KM1197]
MFSLGVVVPIIVNKDNDLVWYVMSALSFFTFLVMAPAICPKFLGWTSVVEVSILENGAKFISIHTVYIFLSVLTASFLNSLAVVEFSAELGIVEYFFITCSICCSVWYFCKTIPFGGWRSIFLVDNSGVTFQQGSRTYSLVPGTGVVASVGFLGEILDYFALRGEWEVRKTSSIKEGVECRKYKSIHLGSHIIGGLHRNDLIRLMESAGALENLRT